VNTLKLPRADMDQIVLCLEILQGQGYLVTSLLNDVNNQLDGQEY
jgi:hypothetical protein